MGETQRVPASVPLLTGGTFTERLAAWPARVTRLNQPNRRGTDPYARWCGRGAAVRLPPIPIVG